jgi:hypothetical protein
MSAADFADAFSSSVGDNGLRWMDEVAIRDIRQADLTDLLVPRDEIAWHRGTQSAAGQRTQLADSRRTSDVIVTKRNIRMCRGLHDHPRASARGRSA